MDRRVLEKKKKEDERRRASEKKNKEEDERVKRPPQRHSREPSDKRLCSRSRSPKPCTSRGVEDQVAIPSIPGRLGSSVGMVTARFTPQQMRRIREMFARDEQH